jgi:hypothetical protein
MQDQIKKLLENKVEHHLRLAAIKQGLEYSALDIVHGVNDEGLHTGSLIGIPSEAPADPAYVVQLVYDGRQVLISSLEDKGVGSYIAGSCKIL